MPGSVFFAFPARNGAGGRTRTSTHLICAQYSNEIERSAATPIGSGVRVIARSGTHGDGQHQGLVGSRGSWWTPCGCALAGPPGRLRGQASLASGLRQASDLLPCLGAALYAAVR
jgi:hypothetical protein